MPDYGDLAYSLAGYGRRRDPYAEKRRLNAELLKMGSDTSPIQSPWQGAARLAQAIAGGVGSYLDDRDEKADTRKRSDALAQAMAEPDPQKRLALLTAYDPDTGARASAQLAVEQSKQQQQQQGLQTAAQNFGGSYGGGPQQATGNPVPLSDASLPPGAFANNAGNIRATNINWQGKGQPQNGFETFATPQAGADAMFKNLSAYVQRNPNMTVAQAIATWAPPNENNTQAYIKNLAEATGINPGMPLGEVLRDPMVAARLMDGIARIEKGGLPQGFTADTFISAAQPGAAPPGVMQGGDGTPPAPNPAMVSGPAVVAPPQAPVVPDVPRPQPTPQMIQQYQQRLASGEFGVGPEAASKARAALDADLDRQWGVARDRAKMEYEQSLGTFRQSQKQAAEAPQQQFGNERKLADAFTSEPAVKSYRVVVPMLESAKDAAARPTRAADLNLIYAFAKLMDPDSVVRESETAGVVATASVAERLQAYIGQLNGQAMLSPDLRAKLIQELDSRFNSLEASYKALEQGYTNAAKAYGLSPERIIMPVRTGQERGNGVAGNYAANAPSNEELRSKWGGGPEPVYDATGRRIR